MSVRILQDTFDAWIDEMPGSLNKLIVIGKVEAPTDGWQVSLERAVPQGVNPQVFVLNLVAVGHTDPATEAVAALDVRYEEPAEEGQFTDVTIINGPDGVSIPVGLTG